MSFVVAIVGRPNVGKSSLFNRIIGEKIAITNDEIGVTRDRIYGKAVWLTRRFNLIDTGGIDIVDLPFLKQIEQQVEFAIDEADLIVFLTDGKNGVTDGDMYIAKKLQKIDKPIILAVNKIDDVNEMNNIYEFYNLGFENLIGISTNHSIGMGDLLDLIISNMKNEEKNDNLDNIKFSIIGRPNVGKSTLTNTILGENRVIVSDVSGTTRDAIDTRFKYKSQEYVVIDTAGIKKRGKIYENTDKYTVIRTLSAIDKSDVCLIVIDAAEGVLEQDKNVAGYALNANKAIIIIVNKWDLVDKDDKTMHKMEKTIRNEFKFLDYAEIIFISAKEKRRINLIFDQIKLAYDNFNKEIKTSILNEIIADAVAFTPPTIYNRGKATFSYITQVSKKPPTFVLFVNNINYVHFSYERYLLNKLRESIDFKGTPIRLILRGKDDK